MNVLVFNCGSSSLKYRLITMPSEVELAGGEAQRVGPPTAEPACIFHRVDGIEEEHQVEMPDHSAAFGEVMRLLAQDRRLATDAVGHRVVHGGGIFTNAAIVSDAVMAELDSIKDMAPLHNPPALALIEACRRHDPNLPQVGVFDTAFHGTIPTHARTYALPRHLQDQLGLHKHGFHGISHHYVAEEAAKFLGRPMERLNAVSCHIGTGGASLCAIVDGRSIDNTMGYSPLQGLVMSTRSGDLDPAVALRLLAQAGGDATAVENVLNKRSGVLGLSGKTADIRDVLAASAAAAGGTSGLNATSQVYLWRIRKYLGAYLAVVGSAHAVIFTDTIGEKVPLVRQAACSGMQAFGLKIDAMRNTSLLKLPADVSAQDSDVRILVIPTNEELAIARQTYKSLTGSSVRLAKGGAA